MPQSFARSLVPSCIVLGCTSTGAERPGQFVRSIIARATPVAVDHGRVCFSGLLLLYVLETGRTMKRNPEKHTLASLSFTCFVTCIDYFAAARSENTGLHLLQAFGGRDHVPMLVYACFVLVQKYGQRYRRQGAERP